MRKVLFSLAVAFIVSFAARAQSGTIKIGIGGEAALPTGDAASMVKTGIGGSAKALFGIGNAGQISFTTGYNTFSGKDLPKGDKATLSMIPFMAGYRQNFGGFYVEPQAGIGMMKAKETYEGESKTNSATRFTWAAGIGYIISNVDLGIRYQSYESEGGHFGFAGVKLAYNIPVSGKK
jgi:hypothetical protein